MGGGSGGGSIFKHAVSGYIGLPRETYQSMLLSPIFTILIVTYLLTFIATIVRVTLWNKKWKAVKKLKEADRKLTMYMLEAFFSMLHHREAIRDLSEQDRRKESRDEDTELLHVTHAKEKENVLRLGDIINTQNILSSRWAMSILSWYVACIATATLAIFWNIFIIDESIGCSYGSDCYYDNDTLIDKCDVSKAQWQASALCYQLSLDFPKAIAEVVGIIFVAAIGFAFLMFLTLLVIDAVDTVCLRVLLYLTIAVFEYSFVAGIILAFVARVEILYKQDSATIIIMEILIAKALLMGVSVPWVLLLWAFSKWRGRVKRGYQKQLED